MRYQDTAFSRVRMASMVAGGLVSMALSTPAHAQYPDEEPTTFGRRNFLHALSTTDLDFGKIAIMGNGGRVELRPDGRRQLTGGLEDLGGTWATAKIIVKGRPHGHFTVLDQKALPLTSEIGRKITLKRLLCEPSRLGKLDARGRAEIKCGGVLRVKKNVRQGTYRAHVRLLVLAF